MSCCQSVPVMPVRQKTLPPSFPAAAANSRCNPAAAADRVIVSVCAALCCCCCRLALTQALSDVLDVLELYSSSSDSSDSAASDSSWWAGACADAGRLLLLLAATGVSPAAAGGSSGGGGASAVLLLMWRLGGEMCAGVWRSEVVTLGWLLMCVSGQQVCVSGARQIDCCGAFWQHRSSSVDASSSDLKSCA